MTGPPTGSDPLNALAEEFVGRYRRGERPALSEYTARHPELAEEIRELFPALVLMEDLGSVGGRPVLAGPAAVPEQLGEFRILREIGRGGMGVVYEAVQESLGRHVALKVLPFHRLLAASQLERFRREARAAAQLHHTNIVPVFGVGEHEGIHFYAMQYIQGQSLDEVIAEVKKLRAAKPGADDAGPRPASASVAGALVSGQFERAGAHGLQPVGLETANEPALTLAGSSSQLTRRPDVQYFRSVARVGVQVADALYYAHRQGILHRDIKPSNLLLDLRGTVWITDFGLAKAEDSGELTRTGDIVGTVRFMPPERLDGRSEPRGDIYSLGGTLYEMLTLRPAFAETQRSRLMDRILHDEPPRPRKLDPIIPADLETIVLTAMAKAPADRYPTAEALADDLRRFLADRPIRARRSSWVEKTWRWCRRNPGWAAMLASVVVLLLVIALGGALFSLNLGRALRQVSQAEAEKTDRLWQAKLEAARALRRSREVGSRARALEAVREAAEIRVTSELRDEAIACLAIPDLAMGPEWADPAADGNVYFDGTLTRYGHRDANGVVTIRRAGDGAELDRLPGPGYGGTPWFSPDDRLLGIRRGRGFKVWDLAAKQFILDREQDHVVGYAFSPDGRHLAAVYPNGTIGVFDLATSQRLRLIDCHVAGIPHALAFHPTQHQLAFLGPTGIQVRDLDTGKMLVELRQDVSAGSQLVWHPSGRTLAVTGRDAKIYFWDVPARRAFRVIPGDTSGATRFAWSPTGDLLAATGWDGVLCLWDTRTGRQLLHTRTAVVTHFRFSRDGQRLAARYDGRRFGIWDVRRSPVFRSLVVSSGQESVFHWKAAFHPWARLLVAAMQEGVGLFDPEDGRELGFLPCGATRTVAFESSGALLTGGPAGLRRWPVQRDSVGMLCIGPPEWFDVPGSTLHIATSPQGGVIACARGNDGALVLLPDRPDPVPLQPQADVRYVAVSPDGRLVATGSHNGNAVKVWEARTGRPVQDLTGLTSGLVEFSPDGKWLATSGGGCRLWDVPTGEEGRRLGGESCAFSPTENLVAVEQGHGLIRLADLPTGQDRARLENPDQQFTRLLCFSPDGTRLAGTVNGLGSIQVWDLYTLGTELEQLGLPWDLLAAAPRARGVAPATVQAVRVLPGDRQAAWRHWVKECDRLLTANPGDARARWQRGRGYLELGQFAEARADYHEAIRRRPGFAAYYARSLYHRRLGDFTRAEADLKMARLQRPRTDDDEAGACNDLAWLYVSGPPGRRAPDRALPLAQRAIRLRPKREIYLNTLGVVYYRLGRYDAAIATLERSLATTSYPAHDLFFLAMSYQQLGDHGKALDCYDQAVYWQETQGGSLEKPEADELSDFRAEAAAVLGVAGAAFP